MSAFVRRAGPMAVIVLVLSGGIPAAAQEFRGSITGRVTDESGAVLPGVTVTAVNVATNVPTPTTTGANGNYTIHYLVPGSYTVTAELQGFKKLERQGIEVRVADRLTLDLSLQVGQLEEVVSVTAESPLLDMASGSAGQVIDEKRISLLPLSDGNPFTLARLAPGIAYTGDLKFSRPFDNAGTSSVVADGASGGNEFTLDGSPNMANGRRVAFVPPAGAVSEFKVETATFDAQQGHTAGATVNVTLKSGTNNIKGESYWYYRDERLSKNDFFLEQADQPKSPLGYDRFGGYGGGPVVKDRTFFFGAVEWLYDEFPEPNQFTVPTQKMRNGDFSELLSAGILIYDPTTAVRRADGRIERQPFPGNIIPADRISSIAREYLNYYPLPNQAGNAQQQNNYLSENPRTDDFYSLSFRGDHRVSSQQQVFVRYTRNNRREARGNWTGEVNGIRPTGNYLFRINDGVTADHVWTMSPSSLLNVRAGWQRFQEPSIRQHQGEFDPSSLGFPGSTSSFFQGDYLPRFEIGGMSVLGDSFAGGTTHSIYSFQPTYTRIMGRHSMRAGWDMRLYNERGTAGGHFAGRYDFNNNFTRQLDNSPGVVTGQQLAAFMLGQPTGGFIDRNADRLNRTWYNGVFIQDDWKVNERLTINLGLRYEYEGATYDTENRNQRGFDPTATLAVAAAAQAAYAANPVPDLPVSQFRVMGGQGFAGQGGRGFWDADTNNIQPRAGFAFAIDDKTVMRGGWGIYTVPYVIASVRQNGFSQATNIVPTLDNGLTFRATLANPFPDGVANPPGASEGPNTFVGRTLDDFFLAEGVRNDQHMRWVIGVQRQLAGEWLLELNYVGNKGYDLNSDSDNNRDYGLNPVPREVLSTSQARDQATINFLTANVPNPFRGLLPGTNLNGNTIQRQQLLRPFPQFEDIRAFRHDGYSSYHAAQARIERRFTKGYTILAAYTYSRFREAVSLLNPSDPEFHETLADPDMPHRLVISGIWELPFGRQRRFGSGANRLVDGLIGGWSVQAIGQIQSGRPLTFGNIYYNGDPSTLKASYSTDTSVPVFDTSGFYFSDAAVQTNGQIDPTKQRNDQRIRLANNLRYFPIRPGVRGQTLNQWDISFVKQVRVTERVRAQLNLEILNAFNQTIYQNPNTDPTSANFGKVTGQFNLPQSLQIAGKILF